MSRAGLVNLLLLGALVAGSVVASTHLPERYPVHFGMDGTPDHWATRESGEWFLLPALAVVLWACLSLIGRWAAQRPALVNLPNKDKLPRLAPERQREALAGLREMMDQLTLLLTLVLGALQVSIYEFAVGGPGPLWMGLSMVLSLVVTPAVLLWRTSRMAALIDELSRQQAAGLPARSGS